MMNIEIFLDDQKDEAAGELEAYEINGKTVSCNRDKFIGMVNMNI
jgi:hypothetical protein